MSKTNHSGTNAAALRSLVTAGHEVARPPRQAVRSVEWRTRAGARTVSPVARAVGLPFEEMEPVRGAPAFRGQWSKPGRYWFSRSGMHVPYESRFEAQHLMLLDHDPHVASVTWQPFRLHFARDRKPHTHVPDFFVRDVAGKALVLDVKGALAAAREDNRLVFSLTARMCKDMGIAYRVATEIDPVLLANVSWFAGYRRQPPGAAALAQAVLDAATATATGTVGSVVEGAARATGTHRAVVRPVLFHLLWRGDLVVRHDRLLDDDAVLHPVGTTFVTRREAS